MTSRSQLTSLQNSNCTWCTPGSLHCDNRRRLFTVGNARLYIVPPFKHPMRTPSNASQTGQDRWSRHVMTVNPGCLGWASPNVRGVGRPATQMGTLLLLMVPASSSGHGSVYLIFHHVPPHPAHAGCRSRGRDGCHGHTRPSGILSRGMRRRRRRGRHHHHRT